MTVLSRRQLLRYGASAVAFASAATMLSPFVLANDDEVTSGDPEPGVGGGDVEVDLTIQDVNYELIDGSTVFMYAFCINGATSEFRGRYCRFLEGRTLPSA